MTDKISNLALVIFSTIIIGLVLVVFFIINFDDHVDASRNSPNLSVLPNVNDIGEYDVYELAFNYDQSGIINPWEDVTIIAQFTSPGKKRVNISGFYYDTDTWKVRFAPNEIGKWNWKTTFQSSFGKKVTKMGSFNVTASENPGFVRKSADSQFRLAFDNGLSYNPIGIGDCVLDFNQNGQINDEWGLDGDTRPPAPPIGNLVDMNTYLSTYGVAGFNLFRWSVDNCSFKLWDYISTSGNAYLVREGKWGDELVQNLHQNGFRIWMTIFGFQPSYPDAVADSPEQAAINRYVNYVMARYGAYVDIWELANEANLPDTWLTSTANYLRSIDPFKRLISTSWERPDLSVIDINSPHWYEHESEFTSDWRAYQRAAKQKPLHKPIIYGEQGNGGGTGVCNWDDASALRMRLRTWSAFFNDISLIFWNTSQAKDYCPEGSPANIYLGPEERSYIRILQDFTGNFDATTAISSPAIVSNPEIVRGYVLRSTTKYAAYLHAYTDHTHPTTDVSLTVDVPANGMLQWINPTNGVVIESYAVPSGVRHISVPPFTIDIALIVM